MGRQRKFSPRVVTVDDSNAWQAAEAMFGQESNARTRLRVVEDFIVFSRLNGVSASPARALKLLAGAMRHDGVEWSTIDTYTGYISAAMYPSLAPADRLLWRSIRDVIRAARADSDTKSARTATADEICAVLPRLAGRVRLAVSTIVFTGARLADAARWRRRQTKVGRNRLRVEVRVAKNRRRRAFRRILVIKDIESLLGLTTDPFLVHQWGDQGALNADEKPLAGITVNEVNKALAVACKQLHLPKLTTYSFRKFFVRRAIEFFDRDWEQIIRFTLHTSINVVAAHYDRLEYGDDYDDQ